MAKTEAIECREALPDWQRSAESKRANGQIARRHQVSEGLIYRWRDKFREG
jgi:transposase-like protein